MAQCEVCGNNYDKSFEVIHAGKPHIFDSFECAIHALAPTCAHCQCRIAFRPWHRSEGHLLLLRPLREEVGRRRS